MPQHGDDAQTLRLMRTVGLAMLSVGAVVSGAGVLIKLGALSPLGIAAQLLATAGFAAGAIVATFVAPSRRLFEAIAVVCVLLLSVILGASNVIGTTPFFFLWPVVYLAYFSSPRVTGATFALMSVSVIVAAALNRTMEYPVDTVVGIVSSVGLMSGLVGAMNRRESSLRGALADAANTDALTGLLNRRAFTPYLDSLVADARGRQHPVTLAIFDLDHFKAYNDTHGHPGGDRLLVRFADILRACAPSCGRVARLGGEEFAVAFEGAGLTEAHACVELVLAALRRELPSDEGRVTASAGVCALHAGVLSSEELMRFADRALYDAKAAGRDRACCWTGPASDPVPAAPGSAPRGVGHGAVAAATPAAASAV